MHSLIIHILGGVGCSESANHKSVVLSSEQYLELQNNYILTNELAQEYHEVANIYTTAEKISKLLIIREMKRRKGKT